ncbi:ABC transporter substrate-binding protein [Streptomyces sp. NPDC057702]|uniref:ABC transporter substrate-binding protein n=1 Tax=unclassified Streptomyces TaxID=2593676 RepID=UPI0036AF6B06
MPVSGVTSGSAARTRRRVALLAAGALLPLPVLAGCGSGGGGADSAAAPVSHDVAGAARSELSGRGTVRWAVDTRPATLNAFHADADAGTDRVAGAVLPTLFTLDARGRAQRDPNYLESAEVVDREPRQVVRYRLHPKAAWSDGRALGVADFRAQWRALRGRDGAYWAARNAGYERIERIDSGSEPGEIEVTFQRPYADWRALFTPLYPKGVTSGPTAFNEGARRQLAATAGPFKLAAGEGGWSGARREKPGEADGPAGDGPADEARQPGRHGRGQPSTPPANEAAERGEGGEDRDQRGAAARDGGAADERREDHGDGDKPGRSGKGGKGDRRAAGRGPGASLTLVRDPRWWGEPARLDKLVLTPVPHAERAAALASGRLDLAEVDAATADRITTAGGVSAAAGARGAENANGARGARNAEGDERPADGAPGAGPNEAVGAVPVLGAGRAAMASSAGALRSWVIEHGPRRAREAASRALADERAAAAQRAAEARALGAFTVRTSLAPSYTQLALNGTAGPLADERVRRAVARAIDREELAEAVFAPLGLTAKPLGSHLAMAGQQGYRDNSGALGSGDVAAARSLLIDAGWTPSEGPAPRRSADAKRDAGDRDTPDRRPQPNTGVRTGAPGDLDTRAQPGPGPDASPREEADADREQRRDASADPAGRTATDTGPGGGADQDRGAGDQARREGAAGPAVRAEARDQPERDRPRGRGPAPDRQAAPGRAPGSGLAVLPGGVPVRVKEGRPLLLRFVVPSGPQTTQAREVGERVVGMLARIGVQTDVVRVADDRYFRDHVARGDFDLALYSWPATAFPATDARPIFAKPRPAPDGSLLVEQNYSRVGTDQIDQLFEQASTELDEAAARKLLQRADARIWAAAGSLPLYQRPQLIAARSGLANVGAFGLSTPRYQDIGYAKAEDAKAE